MSVLPIFKFSIETKKLVDLVSIENQFNILFNWKNLQNNVQKIGRNNMISKGYISVYRILVSLLYFFF